MGITIINWQPIKISHSWVRKIAKRTLELSNVDPKKVSFSLVFVDDEKIKEYNKAYRHEDTFTDVLAFTYGEKNYLGDVIISVERAKAQAPLFGFSFEKELALLIIHGILHLLGYKDNSEKERKKMEDLQFFVLSSLEMEGVFNLVS